MPKSLKQQCAERKPQIIERQRRDLRARLANNRSMADLEWSEEYMRRQLEAHMLYTETEAKRGAKLDHALFEATRSFAATKLKRIQVGLPKEANVDLTSNGNDLFHELAASLKQSVRGGS